MTCTHNPNAACIWKGEPNTCLHVERNAEIARNWLASLYNIQLPKHLQSIYCTQGTRMTKTKTRVPGFKVPLCYTPKTKSVHCISDNKYQARFYAR